MQATSAKEAAPSQPENTSQTSTIARSRRSIDLDFLRGLAIFLVLDFHYGSKGASLLSWPLRKLGLPHFGWGGVDLFFVLSGFLVGGLLIEEWREYHSINVPRFLLRRALKIAPPYYVFLIVMLLRHLSEWRAYIGSFLNIQNYYGINDNVHTRFDHTWSLAVEEHFYLLLPCILLIAGKLKLRTKTLIFIFAGISVCALVLRTYRVATGHFSFPFTHLRIDALFYGVILAIFYHDMPHRFAALQRYRWWLILLTVPGWLFMSHFDDRTIPHALGIAAADISAVAVLLFFFRAEPVRRIWPYRALAWIGIYSYGIYLWHESVLGPIASLVSRAPASLQPWMRAILPWALAIGIGILMTKLIELPVLRLRDRFFPKRIKSPVTVLNTESIPIAEAQS